MRLLWSESARESLRHVVAYIAERDSKAATDLGDRIEASAERLVDHPYMYRTGRVAGTREAVLHANYIMVYRVGADTIEIVNIMHTRR